VARYTTAQPRTLIKGIKGAIEHKGFSFLHIISQCPTQAGRYIYGMTQPDEYLRMIKKNTITLRGAQKCSKAELQGKIITGILHECDDRPEFVEKMNQLKEGLII
jgi:2-oxoglutarate ferredoxin oxidoreductase subunit beta